MLKRRMSSCSPLLIVTLIFFASELLVNHPISQTATYFFNSLLIRHLRTFLLRFTLPPPRLFACRIRSR